MYKARIKERALNWLEHAQKSVALCLSYFFIVFAIKDSRNCYLAIATSIRLCRKLIPRRTGGGGGGGGAVCGEGFSELFFRQLKH